MQHTVMITLSVKELQEQITEAVKLGFQLALRETTPPTERQLLTIPQLAAELQVSTRQVLRCVHSGMPSIGAGKTRRFRLAECLAWMTSQKANRV